MVGSPGGRPVGSGLGMGGGCGRRNLASEPSAGGAMKWRRLGVLRMFDAVSAFMATPPRARM